MAGVKERRVRRVFRSPAVGSAEMRVLVNTGFLFTGIPLDGLGTRIRNSCGLPASNDPRESDHRDRRPMTPVSVQVGKSNGLV